MSYATHLTGQFRNGAEYADRILRGATLADLPIPVSDQVPDLVVNAATADALGLIVPPDLPVDAELVE